MNRSAKLRPGKQIASVCSKVRAQLKANRVAKQLWQPGKNVQNRLTIFSGNSRSEPRVYLQAAVPSRMVVWQKAAAAGRGFWVPELRKRQRSLDPGLEFCTCQVL